MPVPTDGSAREGEGRLWGVSSGQSREGRDGVRWGHWRGHWMRGVIVGMIWVGGKERDEVEAGFRVL